MNNKEHLISQVPFPWQDAHWRRLDRLRLNNQLAHAYLIAGPAGLGLQFFAENCPFALRSTRNKSACANANNVF